MAFVLGVEDASGFYKYLINVIVVTASVAWLLLLFIRSIDSKVYREFKPFSIAMSLQLLFVTIRNLTTLLLSSGFPIQCRWVAVGGIIIYQGFAISAECAMLIRCRSFTRYPRAVTYMTIPTWIVRFALCIWLATTMKGEDNVPGAACVIVMDLQMSAIMQYLKIATEIIICVFFLERVISLHRDEKDVISAETQLHHWRRLALINAGITFLIVLFEILVGQITVYLTDYPVFLTYSMVNLIQATLCVFIVEDTRNVFKERAAAAHNSNSNSNNTHSNEGSGRGSGGPRHSIMSGPVVVSSRYDDRGEEVVSYADAIAAAKAARHSQDTQKPWSLTMRPPNGGGDMHSPAQVHHHTYYMDNMESSSPDSKRTITPQRWRGGEAEDEIPMTRTTKASQDGGAYY
ncbi:hypothetical protein BGZ96_011105 [Linnemannia gamsii]|uniref:Uncharacterized protein n=1 Tax=Linnemannia gamsii TaxID=64522 RepID=A0ABQ7JSW5_9FUNG|nr:hypothetical protein BGZ96_011105 [Linnemannia gamsii]